MRRGEDHRLLTGGARYVADCAVLVRCRAVILLHTSDVHLAHHRDPEGRLADNVEVLEQVLSVADRCHVQAVVLAGDTFDHNRVAPLVVARVAELIARAKRPVVILPGNHDPLVDDSVYYRPELMHVPNLHVLGRTTRKVDNVVLPDLELQIWGRPHVDYVDMAPLATPMPRRMRWQVAVAHGHFQNDVEALGRYRPSWLISPADIQATAADYVALGHWNRRAQVSHGPVPAYYSGALDTCGTVNVVRFAESGVHVSVESVA